MHKLIFGGIFVVGVVSDTKHRHKFEVELILEKLVQLALHIYQLLHVYPGDTR